MKIDSLGNWRRTHYSTEVNPKLATKSIIVMGWVREIRNLGGIRFIIIQDKKGKIQITISGDTSSKEVLSKIRSLHKQDCIGVKGTVKEMSKAPRGVEIIPEKIKVLGTSRHPLPLDITSRTPAEIDVRLDSRVLDLCRDRSQAIFKIRQVTLDSTRNFLSSEGFLEIQTPKIIISATEGGASLFPLVYFEHEAFLAQSPQLYKEELIISFEKVFEIGPFYRAEKSHTTRHITEFTSVDIEEAFVNAEDVIKVAEELMHFICKSINERCKKELSYLKHKVIVPEIPFEYLTYDKVVNELQDLDVKINWGDDIGAPAYRALGKMHPYFYFITDWPNALKPFYIKQQDEDSELSEGFDLMWGWIEIASGGTRVHKKEMLIKNMKNHGLHPESFKYHLQAYNYGMPPHAGWAIGLERLLMLLTGSKNIREVIFYPRDRFRLTP
jgi:aspartyl-tRNA synthetase